MMPSRRTWVVHPIDSAGALAEKLIGHSWCNCQGWSLGGYLFLNDQTSEDGAFEVAVVKVPADPDGEWWQVESITFGWYDVAILLAQRLRETGRKLSAVEWAREDIEALLRGESDPGAERSVAWRIPRPDVETPERHRSRCCQACA